MTDQPEDLRLLLSRSSRTASRHYRAQLAKFELSASQATALLFLNQRHGSNLKELTEALSSDLATASALVDRLMSQGLILRETDPTDRRRARLLLSEAAVALLPALAEATTRTNSLIEDALGHKQAAELAALLSRLLARLDELSTASKTGDATKAEGGEA